MRSFFSFDAPSEHRALRGTSRTSLASCGACAHPGFERVHANGDARQALLVLSVSSDPGAGERYHLGVAGYKHQLRLALRRLGVDVLRFPQSDPMWRLSNLLRHYRVDKVVDVGANDGTFGRTLRSYGFSGELVSFEPLATPFASLAKRADADGKWEVHQFALGDQSGELEIHIAGNDAASSSVLPMLERHLQAAPESAYVGVQKATVRRLDDVVSIREAETLGRRVYVKVDVQGYEKSVLQGAQSTLASSALIGLQLELSLQPLYDGAMLWQEAIDYVSSRGFTLAAVLPGFSDFATGHSLQFDGVFVRE